MLDIHDNCVSVANPEQADFDDDGLGDVCDPNIDDDAYLNAEDCDDFDASVYPSANEVCNGVDDNCDEDVDEGFTDSDGDGDADCIDLDDDEDGVEDSDDNCAFVGNPAQLDTDADGSGDACDPDLDGDGVQNAPDNCPALANVNQADADDDGIGDACDPDLDGDGTPNEADNCLTIPNGDQANLDGDAYGDACDADVDGDGAKPPTDCDDLDGDVYPGADEACDGEDNNCDGSTDSGSNLTGCENYYYDYDQDGYGTEAVQCLCAPKAQFITLKTGDCADTNAAVNPDAEELCDGIDNNCKDGNNEGFLDTDGDDTADCVDYDDDNDGDFDAADNCPLVHNPDQSDIDNDGVGDVCDGDLDADGVPDDEDCAPSDPEAYPGAEERCDGKDNDCDDAIDEVDALGCTLRFADGDGDGYGDAATGACRCPSDLSPGVASAGDCDDLKPGVNPSAEEICDGLDNDCDEVVDEGCDDDGDGYCDEAIELVGSPAVCAKGGGDCDDARADVNGDQDEVCDGVDRDCDGVIDSGCDDDGDGYCDETMTVLAGAICSKGGGDCEDDFYPVNPGVTDTPDLDFKDANCDGIDGDISDAVFVDALLGDDNAAGTHDAALASIQAGVARAVENDASMVLVAAGTYTGPVAVVGGIGIFGGYAGQVDDWTTRAPEGRVLIEAANQPLQAIDIFELTVLQFLDVEATLEDGDSSEPGESVIAFFIRNTGANLRVVSCGFKAVGATAGADGASGVHGAVGAQGLKGTDGCRTNDCSKPQGGIGGPIPCASARTGGQGGAGGSADATGAGGASGEPVDDGGGAGGGGGSGAAGGAASSAKAGNGSTGQPGEPGLAGHDGSALTKSGAPTTTGWSASVAQAGTAGSPGAGGGGGGGGGGFNIYYDGNEIFGAGGGGGGSSGCGGTAGEAGQSGGSTFGVLVVASEPRINGCVIEVGDGAAGGAGGAGGPGGDGGPGGEGGARKYVGNKASGAGGLGGSGGAGGDAGGGAGGCGGHSVGIAWDSASAPVLDANDISVGQAGAAGAGGGPENAGCAGAAETELQI